MVKVSNAYALIGLRIGKSYFGTEWKIPGKTPIFQGNTDNSRKIPGLQGIPMKFQIIQDAYEPCDDVVIQYIGRPRHALN